MQDNIGVIFNEFGKLYYNQSTNLVFQNNSFLESNSHESKRNSEISNKINKNEQETCEEEKETDEKKEYLKQKPNQIYYSKTENEKSQSDSENSGNLSRQKVKLNHWRTKRIITSTWRSLSTSAIYSKKKKEKNLTNTCISKLNFKKPDTTSLDDNGINSNKNHGKEARGILFVNRKRKFIFNCLFVKDKSTKDTQKLGKEVTTFQNTLNKNIMLGISKSLDNILCFNYHKLKLNTSYSITHNEAELNRTDSCQTLAEKCKNNKEKSDYEMVILYLSQKDQGKLSYTETNNKELTDKIFSLSEFSKSSLYANKLQEEYIKKNLSEKSKMLNYPKTFLSPSESVRQVAKNQPSNHLLKAKDKKATSGILCKSDKSFLSSLFPVINSTLSTNNTSDKTIDMLTLSSDQCTSSSENNNQNEGEVISIDEATEKVKSSTGLKEKLLKLIEPRYFSNRSSTGKKETAVNKEGNIKKTDEYFEIKIPESNKLFISTSTDKVAKSNEHEVNFTRRLLNIKNPPQNKSVFSKNENTNVVYKSIKNEAVRNKYQQINSPHFSYIKNTASISKQSDNNTKSELPSMIKEDYTPVKLNQFSNHQSSINESSNGNNKTCLKVGNFEINKQMEDLVYSSFKKQYIPVAKSIHPNKNYDTTSDIETNLRTRSNDTFEVLIEKMSLTNHYFFDKCKKNGDDAKWLTIDDETEKSSDYEIQFANNTDETKNDSSRISFFHDLQINLQKNYVEGDKIRHFTEIMADKNIQKSFQNDNSLKFELQFLDTIYTRRLQEAKKLTQTLSTNENEDRLFSNTPILIDQIPIAGNENKQYAHKNPYLSTKYENKTKLNFCDTENNTIKGTYETNLIQKNRSSFSQVLNNSKSDTDSKWTCDSYQCTSEFSSQLSKQFKRDYIPVRGKRLMLNEINENAILYQKAEIDRMKSYEKQNIYSNLKMIEKENESDENKQNDVVVNIFLTKQDQDSKSPLNVVSEAGDKIRKQSSKISVCISQDSSDEVPEEDDDEEEYHEKRAETKEKSQMNEVTEHQILLTGHIIENSKQKSEIPECKRALFPRIYSDFSIENKCNPVAYKYLLPNPP